MEMCASGHKAGKDSDRRSLAPEPAGWALALCRSTKLHPSRSSAKLEAKQCTSLHGLPTVPSLGDVGSGRKKKSSTSLGPPGHGGTLPLVHPAALGTFRWLSREMSLWPALLLSAHAVPPTPSPPPIHVWNSVCTCDTMSAGSSAGSDNPFLPSPPHPALPTVSTNLRVSC